MKKSYTFLGLLIGLLLLTACAPAATEVVNGEANSQDVDVLVYASPL